MDTKTTEIGSHVVMTGTHRPTRVKYVNIDSRFCDNVSSQSSNSGTATYTISFPERLMNIKSLEVISLEFPYTCYNFSQNIGNTQMHLSSDGINYSTIILPDNQYINIIGLTSALSIITGQSISSDAYGRCMVDNSKGINPIYVLFDSIGGTNNGNINSSSRKNLGWKLGFRQNQYTVLPGKSLTSEAFIDIAGPKYVYLLLEDYAQTAPTAFIAQYGEAIGKKQIVSKVPLAGYTFGNFIHANKNHSLLSTPVRYSGCGVNIKKIQIQLVDEFGTALNINGLDFSFSLKLEFE